MIKLNSKKWQSISQKMTISKLECGVKLKITQVAFPFMWVPSFIAQQLRVRQKATFKTEYVVYKCDKQLQYTYPTGDFWQCFDAVWLSSALYMRFEERTTVLIVKCTWNDFYVSLEVYGGLRLCYATPLR